MTTIKKLLLPLFVVATTIVTISSCKKTDDGPGDAGFAGFDATLSDLTFKLPPVPSFINLGGITIPISAAGEQQIPGDFRQRMDLDSLVRINTGSVFTAADVTSIKVKTMTIVGKNANPTSNLSAFETARFEFFSDFNTTPVEVMKYSFPNVYTDSISYTPTAAPELRGYLNGKELSYRIYGKMRNGTSDTLRLSIRAIVTVK